MRLFHSPPWSDVSYQALDLETSGLDVGRDQILSVGMVPIRNGVIEWGGHDYSLVRAEREENLDGEAIRVHHILPEELHDAPPLGAVIGEVQRRLEGAVLLVHHAPVDVQFLRRAFERTGRRWPRPKIVDTRVLVSRLERRLEQIQPYAKPLPRNLLDLCLTFGLPSFEPHHALWDALATAQLFLALRARLGAKTLRELV